MTTASNEQTTDRIAAAPGAIEPPPSIPARERSLLLAKRQAIIIELGAIEEYLGMERSIVPRRKREAATPEELRAKFERAVRS